MGMQHLNSTQLPLHGATASPYTCILGRHVLLAAKTHHIRCAPVSSMPDGASSSTPPADDAALVDTAMTTAPALQHHAHLTSIETQQQQQQHMRMHANVQQPQPTAPVNPLVNSQAWLWAAAVLASIRIARRDLDAESYFERRQKVCGHVHW